MLVYTPIINSRIQYVFKQVFYYWLDVPVRFTNDPFEFNASQEHKINYSNERISDEFFVIPHPFIYESTIKEQKIQVTQWNNLKIFFQTKGNPDIPFDIFSAIFYLITRYEEYLPFIADQFGRFPASQSLAYKNGFLDLPIINLWLEKFVEALRQQYPDFSTRPHVFHFLPTFDIDNAFAYRHKGILRGIAGTMRSLSRLNLLDVGIRIRTYLRLGKDPYETYDLIYKWHDNNQVAPLFFFLLGNYSKYGKNISHKRHVMKKLIVRTHKKYDAGIHPSFYSSDEPGILLQEIERLSKLTRKKVRNSRQHYLRLRLPETYRVLEKAGIRYDYSMGFADHIGFRAGVCLPFKFFDLSAQKETRLKIFPFQVMDTTLNQYMKLKPDEAIEKVSQIIEQVQKVGGVFSTLWHNHSLSNCFEWKDWRMVYAEILRLCASASAEGQ